MPILNIREMGSIGVVSDVAPWDLPPAAFSDGMNFRLVSGKVQTAGGIEAVSAIAGRDIGHITQSTDLRGNSSWLVCGEDAILLFNGTDFLRLSGEAARIIRESVNVDFSKWTTANVGNVTFFNNPEFNPFYWVDKNDLTPGNLELLPWHIGDVDEETGLPFTETWADAGMSCNIMRAHKNFLFALGMGTPKGQFNDMLHWSHPAEPNGIPFSWRPTIQQPDSIAGSLSLGRGGAIVGGESLRDSFVVYSEDAISIMDFTGDALGWRRRAVSETAGLANPHSLVEVKGQHLFFTGDDILSFDGNTMQSLMHNRLRKRLAANINNDRINSSWAAHYESHNEVWFGVPEDGADFPSHAYCYNYIDNNWSIRDLEKQVVHARAGKEPKSAYLTWDKSVTNWDNEVGSWTQAGDRPFKQVMFGLAEEVVHDLDPTVSTAGGGGVDYSGQSWDGICPGDARSRAASDQLESWVESAKAWNADTRKWADKPVFVPDAPRNVTAVAGVASAAVTWSAPSSDGGSPITGYTGEASPNDGIVVMTGETSCRFDYLINGTEYTFRIRAINAVGTSDYSAASNAVTPEGLAVEPAAPVNVVAVAGDGAATVSWDIVDDGGSPLTTLGVYTIPPDRGIVFMNGDDRSVRLDQLTNGKEYTFTVEAYNQIGKGDMSQPSNAVTPNAEVVDPDPDLDSWDKVAGSWDSQTGTWLKPLDPEPEPPEPIDPTDCSWVNIEGSWSDYSPLASYKRSDTYLQRTDLPIGGHEANTTITRIYPYVEGTAKLEFRFGSQQHAGGPVSWAGGFREFQPGKDRKIDVRTTGELHAYEVRSKEGAFTLTGMDVEFSPAGSR